MTEYGIVKRWEDEDPESLGRDELRARERALLERVPVLNRKRAAAKREERERAARQLRA